MANDLYWKTVTPPLRSTLELFMAAQEFNRFRLVGGTALSLLLGHRISRDIDLFTDVPYETIDFTTIEQFLHNHFSYVDHNKGIPSGKGKSFFIGESPVDALKLDCYCTGSFIDPPLLIDGIRLATLDEIVAMKVDVISRKGRMKDFWDLHEVLKDYSPEKMLQLHQKRYPDTHDNNLIRTKLLDFSSADDDFEPVCLKGKYWPLVKGDLRTWLSQ